MGKSAGKWIKTVLFGKKQTKTNLSKHAASSKKTPAETVVEDPSANTPLISVPIQFSERVTDSFQLEKESSLSPSDGNTLPPLENQGVDSPLYVPSIQVSNAEMRRQQQAAITAQAAFRGYLARRAFCALKGIIRLQALIRGHLVRRQAIATLRCMRAIVQLQALARGRMVRISEGHIGALEIPKHQDANPRDDELNSLLRFQKLATNAFVRKLLIALPNAMPLALQYEISEPNSALQWLERWSLSRFWEPLVRAKKNAKARPQRKQSGSQIAEVEPIKSKRTIRKVATNGDQNASTSYESDKIKRKLRTAANGNQIELTQDQQPQTELERVKRNLRRVSAAAAAAEKSEALPKSVETAVSDLEIETLNVSVVDGLGSPDTPRETTATEAINPSYETPIDFDLEENGVKEDECKEEESSGKEYQKTRKRNSLPANKQEYAESILQNDSPALPSYMAATKSAKAKLRGHGSSKFGEDGGDQGYNVRRHSLPALTSGKLSSISPRIEKPSTQANGKRGSRAHRSSTTSRDDRVLQPGWRR